MADPLLADLIGEEAFEAVSADPVLFIETFSPERPWPFQAEAMRTVVERDEDGKFAKKVWVVSWPRQNGKSQVSSWIGTYLLFTDPDCRLIVTVALDWESARIIFDRAKNFIQDSETLYSLVDPDHGFKRTEVRLKDGRRWIIKSADARMSRGLSPSIVLEDELGWTIDDGALYQVLAVAQAAQVNSLTLVTSTVSPVMDGPLWDLMNSNDPHVGILYRQDNPSPLVTEELLRLNEELLPPTIFAREHRNEWVEGGDTFATEADWQRATSRGDPIKPFSKGPCYGFLDLGWTHDESVLAIVQDNGELGTTDVIHLETWKGSQSKPVHLPAVRDRVSELIEQYGIKHLQIESPQGVSMAQELSEIKYTKVDFLHPTSATNAERYGAFYRALKDGGVRLPDDPLLRRQMLTMTIRQTTGGLNWKVEDRPDIHNDRVVACAGALYLVTVAGKKTTKFTGGFMLDSGFVNSRMQRPDKAKMKRERPAWMGTSSQERRENALGKIYDDLTEKERFTIRQFAALRGLIPTQKKFGLPAAIVQELVNEVADEKLGRETRPARRRRF